MQHVEQSVIRAKVHNSLVETIRSEMYSKYQKKDSQHWAIVSSIQL